MREPLWKDHGKRASRKEAARLMREHGLNARKGRNHIPVTGSSHGPGVCPNVLNREFAAERDGEKWISSYQRYAITYLRTAGGRVYLTTVLDL
ncbi:MAG: hypothetical protein LBO80_00565 [Treponema sp.]|nr:hypothetical protein [Treponema sp.]